MKKKTDYTIPLLIVLFLFAVICSCRNETKMPVNVQYFNNGDTLFPDYAIPDTLIVVNAIGLNKEIAWNEQGLKQIATDQEIATVFYKYCKVKK